MNDPDRWSGPAYAHTAPPPATVADWEPYADHRDLVARYAGDFADAFGARAWGDTLGRWHDLGKLSAEWQDYLRKSGGADAGEEESKPGRVDHSTFGARHAATLLPGPAGQLLAHCIAGHHGGLLDGTASDDSVTLKRRLNPADYARCKPVDVPAGDRVAPTLVPPFPRAKPLAANAFPLSFFTRMLFSCLVDADRTATEQFCDPASFAERSRAKPTVAALRDALDASLDRLTRDAPPTPVNAIRAEVLADCRAAASKPPGLFALDVPTGGGKTFASLAFALRHADANGLRRVGAWIATVPCRCDPAGSHEVAPSRERGLQPLRSRLGQDQAGSLLHGSVDCNLTAQQRRNRRGRRSFTGASIRTRCVGRVRAPRHRRSLRVGDADAFAESTNGIQSKATVRWQIASVRTRLR